VQAAIKAQPPKMIPSTSNVKYFVKRGMYGFQEGRTAVDATHERNNSNERNILKICFCYD
jgi:hypothetical protein